MHQKRGSMAEIRVSIDDMQRCVSPSGRKIARRMQPRIQGVRLVLSPPLLCLFCPRALGDPIRRSAHLNNNQGATSHSHKAINPSCIMHRPQSVACPLLSLPLCREVIPLALGTQTTSFLSPPMNLTLDRWACEVAGIGVNRVHVPSPTPQRPEFPWQ